MKKGNILMVVLFSLCFIVGTASSSSALTISFINPFQGVDNTTGWSTDDTTVGLNVTSFSILNGFGEVRSVNGIQITQRGTRGLGVDGTTDSSNNPGDEYDELDYPEKLQVYFDAPVLVSMIEIRSLFSNEGEKGSVNFWNGNTLITTITFNGTQSGELILNPNLTITRMAFNAPGDLTDGPISEYALTGFEVQVPEPGTIMFLGIGLASLGLAIRGRRK